MIVLLVVLALVGLVVVRLRRRAVLRSSELSANRAALQVLSDFQGRYPPRNRARRRSRWLR